MDVCDDTNCQGSVTFEATAIVEQGRSGSVRQTRLCVWPFNVNAHFGDRHHAQISIIESHSLSVHASGEDD